MSQEHVLAAGRSIGAGRFTLVRQLGRGGMGEVWLARDERLNEDVALKFLPPEVRADPVAIDDLRRETARSHRLAHPHIVRIHDLHENPGEPPFIAMEFVDGRTLSAQRLEQPDRVMRWDELRPIVQQLCAALDYAHCEGVIHRDLKPANLMRDSKGRLKLADFGIAAVVSDSVSRVSALKTSGTLAYMSPQQLAGKRPTVGDDIYALGATLYELLTSKPPFFTGDLTHQILHEAPEPLEERLAALGIDNPVPADVAAMVMACLAKEPGQRPQSAQAVAAWIGLEISTKPALQHLTQEVFSETPPAEEPGIEPPVQPVLASGPAFSRKWIWMSAAIGALLLLALGSWYGSTHVIDFLALDFFPMAVGATWEYAAETATRVPGREPQIRSGTEVCRCVAIEKISGKEYFKVVTFFRGFPDTPEAVTWYRRAADGIYRIDGKSENPERLFLPLPPRSGYSWTVEESTGKSVSSIEAIDTVDLPERSYRDCVKLHTENSDKPGKIVSQSTFYFARDIGGVKGDLEFGDLTLKLRLDKCSLPRQARYSGKQTEPSSRDLGPPTSMRSAAPRENWISLFDGPNVSAWKGRRTEGFPDSAWAIEDGWLRNFPESERDDLTTRESFQDFELEFEWRISPGGNSGVFYGLREYQIVDDDNHPDGKRPVTSCGAFCSILAPNEKKRLHPAGQINQGRIVVAGRHVEHWMNGEKILEYELGSEALKSALELGLSKRIPGLQNNPSQIEPQEGAIILQTHTGTVWFRHIRIKRLTATDAGSTSQSDSSVVAGIARWTNSLAMVFLPVPGTHVQFSIWETRVRDFAQFIKETHHDMSREMSWAFASFVK